MTNKVRYPYQKFISEEHRTSFGELYPDKTFYVIRMRNITSGIGAIISLILRDLDYMEKTYGEDTIPVIDMSCYWGTYVERDEIGIINWWEYYFDQPTFYGTDAAYNAKNVIMNNAQFDEERITDPKYYDMLFDDEEYRQRMLRLFDKYIHVNGRFLKKVDKLYRELFSGTKRVLGYPHRGSGYRNCICIGERIQHPFEEEMDFVEQKMKEWNCDHVFFTTEDEIDHGIAKERFKDKMISVPQTRYPNHAYDHVRTPLGRPSDCYLKGEDYMFDICLMAKCDCLISTRHGILYPAMCLNQGKYEEMYFWTTRRFTRDDYVLGSFAKNILAPYRRSTLGGAEHSENMGADA